jgi:hypothetical protein
MAAGSPLLCGSVTIHNAGLCGRARAFFLTGLRGPGRLEPWPSAPPSVRQTPAQTGAGKAGICFGGYHGILVFNSRSYLKAQRENRWGVYLFAFQITFKARDSECQSCTVNKGLSSSMLLFCGYLAVKS